MLRSFPYASIQKAKLRLNAAVAGAVKAAPVNPEAMSALGALGMANLEAASAANTPAPASSVWNLLGSYFR